MKKLALFVSIAVLTGCNAAKQVGSGSTPTHDFSGSWEVVATSTINSGVISYVEFNATQSANNLTAPVQEFILGTSAGVRGNCFAVAPGNPQGDVSATINGSSITGTFSEIGPQGSASFSIQAPLTSDTSFSGNFSGTKNSPGCVDSGTFVATKATPLSGSYGGMLTYPDGTQEMMSLTATEDSAYDLTVYGAATGGSENGPIALSGTVTGNLARLHSTTVPLFSGFAWWDVAAQKLDIVDDNGYEYGFLVRQ